MNMALFRSPRLKFYTMILGNTLTKPLCEFTSKFPNEKLKWMIVRVLEANNIRHRNYLPFYIDLTYSKALI